MTLPRGFKAYSQTVAADIRTELGLGGTDPLNPWRLAEHLDIPCWALTSLAERAPGATQLLLGAQQRVFSAFVLCVGRRRLIVYNDGHALTRQRSNIAHELAHALLWHDPHPTDTGLAYDSQQEEQASWLGGVLLVPDRACVALCRAGRSLLDSAAQMGVSQQLMQWRLNMSGAQRRVDRERRRAA